MGPQAQAIGHGKNSTRELSVRETVARRVERQIEHAERSTVSTTRPRDSVQAMKGCVRVLRHLDAVADFNGLGKIAAHLRSVAVIQRVIRWGKDGAMPSQGGEFFDQWSKLRAIHIETDAQLIATYQLIEAAYNGKTTQSPAARHASLVREICDAGHIPTSKATADLMAEIAGVDPGERVLVPCGGIGPLVQAAVDREAGEIWSIEIEHKRHEAMALRFSDCPSVRLSRANFLNDWRNDGDLFDVVLICPPEFDAWANVLRSWRSVRGPIEEVGKKPSEWITGGLVALLDGVPADHDRLFRDLRDRGAAREINTTLVGGGSFILDAWRDS